MSSLIKSFFANFGAIRTFDYSEYTTGEYSDQSQTSEKYATEYAEQSDYATVCSKPNAVALQRFQQRRLITLITSIAYSDYSVSWTG